MGLRAAILGTGGMGRRHTKSLRSLGVEITSVCDTDSKAIQTYRETFPELSDSLQIFTNFEEMLEEANAEVVFITVPPFAQNGQFEKAAQYGKHIFIEKPIALDIHSAERMVESAVSAGIITSVGFHLRQGAVVQRIKKLIELGRAGKPVLFHARYACNSLHTPWWRQKNKSGGQILEQVIHLYDLSRYLVGDPVFVSCSMANICHRDVIDYSVEDVSASICMTARGAVSSITATNCAIPGKWSESFYAVYENLTIECSDVNSAVITYTDKTPVKTETIQVQEDNHLNEVREFIRCVEEGEQTSCPVSEGMESLRYAAAAVESAERKGEKINM